MNIQATTICLFFLSDSKKITFRDTQRERGGGGGRGRAGRGRVQGRGRGHEGRRKFAKDLYKDKSCYTHSVVVTCSFQQVDVDKLQMEIAIAILGWLLMQSQDFQPCSRT